MVDTLLTPRSSGQHRATFVGRAHAGNAAARSLFAARTFGTRPATPYAIRLLVRVAREADMLKFLLWLLLLIFCWPLALLALVLYPFVWLLSLPFRLVGVAVEGVFELLRAILMLPARVLGGRRPAR